MTENLATKADLLATKADLEKAIASLREELRGENASLRIEFRDLHTNLIRWFVPLMIGQTAAVAALVKLL